MILGDLIVPSGDRIRRLRKILGLKQEEITDGKITRNLISYIENGKTRLMPDTAKIIADCINIKAREQGKDMFITSEYLLEDEVTQADRLLGDLIEALQRYDDNKDRMFLEELRKAEKLLDKYDIPYRRVKIYELASEWYYNKGQIHDSYLYNMKLFENSMWENDLYRRLSVIIKLAKCALRLNNYNEAIILNNYALSISNNNEHLYVDIIKKALFNNALAYKKLSQYDMCLVEIAKLELKFDNLSKNEKFDVDILKGNCYLNKNEYSIALEIYGGLLEDIVEFNDTEKLIAVYNNIAAVYYVKEEYNKSLEYRHKCYELSREIESINSKYILFQVAQNYEKLNKFDLAEKNLLVTKKMCSRIGDIALLIDANRLLSRVYMQTSRELSLKKIVEEMVGFIGEVHTLTSNDALKIERLFFEVALHFIYKDTNYSRSIMKLGLKIQENI